MSERATGNIYDLGYRRYEGTRLGRTQSVLTLYVHSLRAAFGFGRRTVSKLFPIGFTIVAFIPALAYLGVAALIPADDFEFWVLEDYFDTIQYILALFVATAAPELVGRDQRTRTLSLYFSRALSRLDYSLAKLAAMTTAMLFLTLGPVFFLYLGSGLAEDDVWGYFTDNASDFLPIILSSLFVSLVMSSIGLAIGANVPRRSYATLAILATFVVPLIVAGIIIGSTDIDFGRWSIFIAPQYVLHGVTYYLFQADEIGFWADADLYGGIYIAAALVWFGVATALLVRRFQRVTA